MALVSKNPQRQAGKVELLPGLKLWRVVDVTAEDYKGYDVDARVVLDGDRFTATEVRVRQRPGGPPVNGEALRQVALTGFITNAIAAPWSRPISAAPPLRTCTPMRCRSSPLRPVPTRPR